MSSDEALLESVLTDLGISGDDEDVKRNISLKIKAVKGYLIKAGAKIEDNCSEEVISCIAIGVNDLLNNKAGETKFSPAFNMLSLQICRG